MDLEEFDKDGCHYARSIAEKRPETMRSSPEREPFTGNSKYEAFRHATIPLGARKAAWVGVPAMTHRLVTSTTSIGNRPAPSCSSRTRGREAN